MAVPGPEPFYHLQSGIDAAMRIVEIRECAIPLPLPVTLRSGGSKNSKANRIETGERSGGIGEICSVEVEEK
jgi:hypothetical protein